MSHASRRDFLKLLGATTAFGAFPPSIRAALATAPDRTTGTLQDVQHVVILMQENRAFDHYLGTLRGVRGFGDPRTVPLPGGGGMWRQPLHPGAAQTLAPFRLDTRTTAAQMLADINHEWKHSHRRWKDHDEWIDEKGPYCMGYFTREDLPFYHSLADAFTVCDACHSSIQGPTGPNRLHLFSGTSGLTVGDAGEQAVTNHDDGNWTADMANDMVEFAGLPWTTYAERLQGAGIAWRVYQEHDNFGDNPLGLFGAFRKLDHRSELYRRGRAYAPGSNPHNSRQSRGEYMLAEFEKDVRGGTLPAVSWIVPPYLLSEHPEASPAYGQSFTSRLLAVMAANPQVWSKTVFIINYDENGGFFDHVPPPIPATHPALGGSTVDTSTEVYRGQPVGLGIRVPMFIVSPWSRGGWVNSQVFDHTSVIRFLEARFGVHEPNISAWRRSIAGDLTSTLDFDRPAADWPRLPDTSDYITLADDAAGLPVPPVPADPSLPRQEPGIRPARPLPYALASHGRVDAGASHVELGFSNRGMAGAVFNVYAPQRDDGPWYFTLDPGAELAHRWDLSTQSGAYGLHVYGPNGFLRVFAGDAGTARGANPEVVAAYDPRRDCLVLDLRNAGTAACTLQLRPNLYARTPPRTIALPAGGQVRVEWPLAASHHWYDLSLTSDSDPAFLRRLAGHVETGGASISDPAFGA